MPRLALSLATLAVWAAPLAAQTLDPDAAPRQGTIQLGGGATDALDLALSTPDEHPGDCPGFLDASAPDAVVEWGGAGAMRLWVRSSADATLTVVGPDGETRCEDDVDGVQPALLYEQPARGRYAVWVGAFGFDAAEGADATLYAGPPPPPVRLGDAAGAPALVFDGEAEATMEIEPGGLHPAAALGMPDYCTGFFHAEPTARVSGPTPFTLAASSDADLTLAVRTRGGGWLCNDDQGPWLSDPAIEVEGAGEQTVWVGTFRGYARAESPTATLSASDQPPMSELEPPPALPRERFSEASYTTLDVDAPGEALTLGASADSTGAVYDLGELVQNPVTGDACRGLIAPSRTLTLTAEGDGPITLYATGPEDLVMVARDGDGQWFCSDDATGRDPAIEVAPGEIAVWVGTFAPQDGVTATFSAMRGAIEDRLPEDDLAVDFDFEDIDFGATSYADGAYEGDELGGAAQTSFDLSAGRLEAEVAAGGGLFMPVEGDVCTGYITPAPTASVESGAETIAFTASAMEDLTLLVRTPNGRWICSDDHDGRDPGIEVSGAGDGTYTIWVGTFDALDVPVDAVLTVEEGVLGEAE